MIQPKVARDGCSTPMNWRRRIAGCGCRRAAMLIGDGKLEEARALLLVLPMIPHASGMATRRRR